MTIAVRTARPADSELIYQMIRKSAIVQGCEQDLCATPDNLREDGFALQPPRFQCLIAECDGQPAGMALYCFIYSTSESRNGIYLEDLYVLESFRRVWQRR